VRKDYIPVSDRTAAASDETAFVERYWADVWKRHDAAPDVSALARRDEYRVIRPYLARLAKGSRVLDGGCGLGEWTVFLSQQGFEVVGLDLVPEVIDALTRRFPGSRFVRADIRRTGFDDGSFDACFSWGAFEHFENGMGECLDEARRILRPGGWLFISVPFHNWRHILRDARPLQRWNEHFDPAAGFRESQRFYQWRFTRPELQRELELHGFRAERITPIHKLSGAGRWLQWDFPVVRKDTRAYFLARRAIAAVMPAGYISHMLLAVGERR
jgi:SAM-dependent methyltransferase